MESAIQGDDRRVYAFQDGDVGIRPLIADDVWQFLAATDRSRGFHGEWIQPPMDEDGFEALLRRSQSPNFKALAVVLHRHDSLVGMIHFSEIIRGAFQNAFCSYWVGIGSESKGIMTEALRLALHFAFQELKLHRIEANIQPGNLKSIALVNRCGFVKEGFSEKYLQIEGEWKDHERWAIHSEIWKKNPVIAGNQPILR